MTGFDAVFVGSGINSLAGAALLAKDGWRVCVLERNDWLGGAIKTVEGMTAPGFAHEVFASWHPLWVGSPAYAELKPDLDRLGLEYLNTDLPTATAFPNGSSTLLSTDGAANTAELGEAWQRQFDQFMAGADVAFGVLGSELWSGEGLSLGRKAYKHFGRRGLVEFAGHSLRSARDWLTDTFDQERAHGLLAPWVLHTGLGPDQAMSGFMTQVIACAIQLGGMPVPKGGGAALVDGLAAIVRDAGGELRTDSYVERIVVSEGKATGVRLAEGETIAATRAVLVCVTPTQLYGRLLGQPMAVDPSRGPEGSWVLWVQLQELPPRAKGDAVGEIDVGDGTWTEDLREAYADRIVERIGRHIENLGGATIGRVVLSPADLEAANPNWVGGDIYAGSCSLDQNLVFRPTPATPGHATPVAQLWHIGASTHPGPGLGAGSGYLVAKQLTRRSLPRRLFDRLDRTVA